LTENTPLAYRFRNGDHPNHPYTASLKRLGKLGASSSDIIAMEEAIARAPEAGTVIRGPNGLR
jgi:hypothetical protein